MSRNKHKPGGETQQRLHSNENMRAVLPALLLNVAQCFLEPSEVMPVAALRIVCMFEALTYSFILLELSHGLKPDVRSSGTRAITLCLPMLYASPPRAFELWYSYVIAAYSANRKGKCT